MKKTVLIPTDFTIESLNAVKTFLNQADDRFQYNIILLHGVDFTDSITEALFFTKSKFIASVEEKDFPEACNIIKNKFSSQINSIRKDVFTGFNQSAFNNYIEANKVNEAFVPVNYNLQMVDRKSFDLLPFIKNSTLTVSEIEWDADEMMPEKGKLAEIFFNRAPAAH